MSGTSVAMATARLAMVPGYSAPGPVREEAFHRLARLTAKMLRVPIALVSVVGRPCCGVNAQLRPGIAEITADRAFRDHVLAAGGPLVVRDAHHDPRFADSPVFRRRPGGCASAPACPWWCRRVVG